MALKRFGLKAIGKVTRGASKAKKASKFSARDRALAKAFGKAGRLQEKIVNKRYGGKLPGRSLKNPLGKRVPSTARKTASKNVAGVRAAALGKGSFRGKNIRGQMRAFFAKLKSGVIKEAKQGPGARYTAFARGVKGNKRTKTLGKKKDEAIYTPGNRIINAAGRSVNYFGKAATRVAKATAESAVVKRGLVGGGAIAGGAGLGEIAEITVGGIRRDIKTGSRRQVRSQFREIEVEKAGFTGTAWRDIPARQRQLINARAKKREKKFFNDLSTGRTRATRVKRKVGRPRTVKRKPGPKRRVGRPKGSKTRRVER